MDCAIAGRVAAAGAAYALAAFALGFVLGTLRVLVVAPHIGEWAATLVELPLMLAAAWWLCGRVIARFAVPPHVAARAAMGALALVLLIAAEIALGMLAFARGPAAAVAAMTQGAALAGLGGQVVFAGFPLLRLWRS